ncbi:hypothetical protein C5C24_06540 [Rathayibacter sp. AY2B3]|nr:hypothetical protein C5C24_06540 [Rathayibacter sp. AY2B3]PPI27324.1 hypothetical protein C5D44_04680 [Rathayibacter sp. AY1B5]
MTLSGYDAAVAEAHGYQIVVHDDGTFESIPVTDAAKKEAEELAIAGGGLAARDTRSGNCGTSTLFITRAGSSGINIYTAYSVTLGYSIGHEWKVDGATSSGTWSEDFNGLAASTTWSATHFKAVGGNASGFGQVRAGSYAILNNGLTCSSALPYDAW